MKRRLYQAVRIFLFVVSTNYYSAVVGLVTGEIWIIEWIGKLS